jgi:hypothetical protein
MQIKVTDALTNPVPGVTVTFTSPISAPTGYFGTSASPANIAAAITDSTGIATAPAFTAGGILGSYLVNATISGISSSAIFHLTNGPGAPATLVATQGDPQATYIGAPFAAPLQVTAIDAYGNPVPGVPVTFTAPASGSTGQFSGGSSSATAVTGS